MAVAYSPDLRQRVMAARDGGLATGRVAELFRVSPSWVRRIMQRRRDCGETAPRPRGGATVVKVDLQRLRQLVDQQPDATVRELHQWLGIDCSPSTVDMALRRLGFTFKKRRCRPRSRIDLMSTSSDEPGGSGNNTANPSA